MVVAVVVATLTFLIRDHLVRTLFVDPVMRCGSRRFETQVHVDNLNFFSSGRSFFTQTTVFFNTKVFLTHKAFFSTSSYQVFSLFLPMTRFGTEFFLFLHQQRHNLD